MKTNKKPDEKGLSFLTGTKLFRVTTHFACNQIDGLHAAHFTVNASIALEINQVTPECTLQICLC